MWYLPGKLFILSNIILNAQFQAHHNHNCANHVMQQSHESEPVDPPSSLREATQVENIGQTVLWSLASTYLSSLTWRMLPWLSHTTCICHHHNIPSTSFCKGHKSNMSPKRPLHRFNWCFHYHCRYYWHCRLHLSLSWVTIVLTPQMSLHEHLLRTFTGGGGE